jgi:hypothetical protein
MDGSGWQVKRRSGHIILIASGAAAASFLGYSSYAPTKFAVRGLGDALRNELVGTGGACLFQPNAESNPYSFSPRSPAGRGIHRVTHAHHVAECIFKLTGCILVLRCVFVVCLQCVCRWRTRRTRTRPGSSRRTRPSRRRHRGSPRRRSTPRCVLRNLQRFCEMWHTTHILRIA